MNIVYSRTSGMAASPKKSYATASSTTTMGPEPSPASIARYTSLKLDWRLLNLLGHCKALLPTRLLARRTVKGERKGKHFACLVPMPPFWAALERRLQVLWQPSLPALPRPVGAPEVLALLVPCGHGRPLRGLLLDEGI